MKLPLQVTFRGFPSSDALEERIREKVEALERFYPDIMSCRVVIEEHHRHQRTGRQFHVRVDLMVPGGEIVVAREPTAHQSHQDPYVAVRDAFDAVRRKLQDFAQRQRFERKAHDVLPHGVVIALYPYEGYGFVRDADGEEVYFHHNAVPDDGFYQLQVGDRVRVVVQEGESPNGPQASSVIPLGKHHLPDVETLRE